MIGSVYVKTESNVTYSFNINHHVVANLWGLMMYKSVHDEEKEGQTY